MTREQELEALLQEIRRVVAHDVRNPLSIIVGQADLLRQGMGGDKAVDAIVRNADRLTQMLNDLADRVTGAVPKR